MGPSLPRTPLAVDSNVPRAYRRYQLSTKCVLLSKVGPRSAPAEFHKPSSLVTQAHQLEVVIIRLAVNENEVRPDMAIAVAPAPEF